MSFLPACKQLVQNIASKHKTKHAGRLSHRAKSAATFGPWTVRSSVPVPVRSVRTDEAAELVESLPGKALLRSSEGRTEIAQFVVDLLGFPYGLGDFFAE